MAMHNFTTKNHHIKVYASIRQEAYSGFTHDDKRVIEGSMVMLDYSKSELEEMFHQAISRYTQHVSLPQFLYTSSIANGANGKPEKPFDYIYRHSTFTARSIMYMGQSLHNANLEKVPVDNR
ncbi:hypothetical protein ACFLVS_04900 [Chloroflexota bacterium]